MPIGFSAPAAAPRGRKSAAGAHYGQPAPDGAHTKLTPATPSSKRRPCACGKGMRPLDGRLCWDCRRAGREE